MASLTVAILLKNSFSADERNFSASLVHPTRGNVRDQHRFPQRRSQIFVAVPQWLAAAERTKTRPSRDFWNRSILDFWEVGLSFF